jgi:hypothetical protein
MILDIYCPHCKNDFEIEIDWGDTKKCSFCDKEFWMDEFCTEDYEDCWITIEWW